jgi:hypothetical protein
MSKHALQTPAHLIPTLWNQPTCKDQTDDMRKTDTFKPHALMITYMLLRSVQTTFGRLSLRVSRVVASTFQNHTHIHMHLYAVVCNMHTTH